ncbi:hypothetical protein CLF_103761 [Clonorchis sinensis]|uniref:Uncharacterized protein n=1 Tax=Clonorchis sinensis TaxID=79923 RepID=G7YAB9_CLOSI|nr:hypothetical protein CLF_103761 [Clonorchis sinensis]
MVVMWVLMCSEIATQLWVNTSRCKHGEHAKIRRYLSYYRLQEGVGGCLCKRDGSEVVSNGRSISQLKRMNVSHISMTVRQLRHRKEMLVDLFAKLGIVSLQLSGHFSRAFFEFKEERPQHNKNRERTNRKQT